MKQIISVISQNLRKFMELHNASEEQSIRDYWLTYMSGSISLANDFGYEIYVHHENDLRYKDIDYITISYQGIICETVNA